MSAVYLQGRTIELSSSVNKRLVKMLLDSSDTSNFISNAMASVLKLQVQEDEEFYELTLLMGLLC